MNSHSDSRSRFGAKNSLGSVASSRFSLPSSDFSGSMTRLNPVPTGSTNTTSVNPSHDASFSTSRGGGSGSVPSGGNSTRIGPTAPRCRNADDAPGPPLKTNVTGRSSPPSFATYATEKISADGFSFLRRTSHSPVAAYSIGVVPPLQVARRLRPARAARGRASCRSSRPDLSSSRRRSCPGR